MPSAAYKLFRRAILEEKQITCVYNGHYRELCPHIIGYTNDEEKVLAFQFGGSSSSKLPPRGEAFARSVCRRLSGRILWRRGRQPPRRERTGRQRLPERDMPGVGSRSRTGA